MWVTPHIGISVPHRRVDEDDDIQTYKRAWVSLTDEQIHKCIAYAKGGCDIEQTAKNIELKLKGLNYD
jgi:hypothetical protein